MHARLLGDIATAPAAATDVLIEIAEAAPNDDLRGARGGLGRAHPSPAYRPSVAWSADPRSGAKMSDPGAIRPEASPAGPDTAARSPAAAAPGRHIARRHEWVGSCWLMSKRWNALASLRCSSDEELEIRLYSLARVTMIDPTAPRQRLPLDQSR